MMFGVMASLREDKTRIFVATMAHDWKNFCARCVLCVLCETNANFCGFVKEFEDEKIDMYNTEIFLVIFLISSTDSIKLP